MISGAYFGDTTSPGVGIAQPCRRCRQAPNLYDNIRETFVISAVSAGDVARCIRIARHDPAISMPAPRWLPSKGPSTCRPSCSCRLVVVGGLALLKAPPFTAIFVGALAGGLVAVFVAPERVIAFAGAPDGTPRWLALLKGVWLALAGGICFDDRSAHGRPVGDAWRHGQHAANDLAHHSGPRFRRRRREGGRAGATDHAGRRCGRSTAGWLPALSRPCSRQTLLLPTNTSPSSCPGACSSESCPSRAWADRGQRSVGASGTPTSALVPWNSCGAYLAATLGVPTLSYAPYAVFGIASPLLTIAAGYMGFRVLRSGPAPTDETGRLEGGAADKS